MFGDHTIQVQIGRETAFDLVMAIERYSVRTQVDTEFDDGDQWPSSFIGAAGLRGVPMKLNTGCVYTTGLTSLCLPPLPPLVYLGVLFRSLDSK